MLAYNKNPKLKAGLLREVHKHYKHDQIVKGTYGEENGKWKGCAVGCSIRSYNLLTKEQHSTGDHSVFEKFGIPEWLARLDDTIFEGLPSGRAEKWPHQFLKAIRPGANLDKAKAPFVIFILEQNLTYFDTKKFPAVEKAIRDCIKLYKAKKWDSKAAARSAESAAYEKYADKLLEILKSL